MAQNGWGSFLLGAGLGLIAGAFYQQLGNGQMFRQGQRMLQQAGRALESGAGDLAEMAEEFVYRATPNATSKTSSKRERTAEKEGQDVPKL
ncbi:MAG: hypothetical protein IMW86_05400 [Hydrogenibacillus sp.]|nr:hypothetical protein [Hydrogenibacillus sp.]